MSSASSYPAQASLRTINHRKFYLRFGFRWCSRWRLHLRGFAAYDVPQVFWPNKLLLIVVKKTVEDEPNLQTQAKVLVTTHSPHYLCIMGQFQFLPLEKAATSVETIIAMVRCVHELKTKVSAVGSNGHLHESRCRMGRSWVPKRKGCASTEQGLSEYTSTNTLIFSGSER